MLGLAPIDRLKLLYKNRLILVIFFFISDDKHTQHTMKTLVAN